MKKAFDQTVRDLKREVNKKVLKVPPVEQKVLDATSNEPWGPHGTLLADIAQASRNYYEYQMIMSIIWKRISDTGKNWRHVYKALIVLEYLVAHGSERVIDDIREHTYHVQTLSDFQYIDSSGKDQGNNVRKKSQSLVLLVNDKERIQEARQKAASNRDKFRNTSMGNMYRPGSYSSSGGYGDRYDYEDRNGYGGDREYGYRDDDRYGKYGDPYGREGDRYGREYEDSYSRDDESRGRSHSVDEYHYGPRSRSSDRDRDRSLEDDGQDSSSAAGNRIDRKYSEQNLGGLDRKYSEQNLGAPPSYEEALGAARSPTHGESQMQGSSVASPPPAQASPPPYASPPGPVADNSETDGFDEFDPRGAYTAAPVMSGVAGTASSSAEMDLIGSLALVPVTSVTAASEAETSINSASGATYVATSSASISNQTFEDPFGDGPFRALSPQSDIPGQHSSVSVSFQSSFNQVPELPQQVFPKPETQEQSTSDMNIDILADILPPTGPPHLVNSQGEAPAPVNQPVAQQGFLPPTGQHGAQTNFTSQSSPTVPQTGFSSQLGLPTPEAAFPIQSRQPWTQGSFPVQSSHLVSQATFHSQSGQAPSVPGFANQAGQTQTTSQFVQPSSVSGFPSHMGPFSQSPQPNGTASLVGQQMASQVLTGSAAQQNARNNLSRSGSGVPSGSLMALPDPGLGSSAFMVSQSMTSASVGSVSTAFQPTKDKFETKSTVWTDTLSRGLVNLNISGPKTNPLADIGVDFDALNRKEKRMEKPTATQAVSTVAMGKAMGSGSGMGREGAGAGAGALRPSNPMMSMGMAGPPRPGIGIMGGYTGMNQPMAVGRGMNMQPRISGMGMNMGVGGMMQQQPTGFGPGSTIARGYNPSMGAGIYGQQPFGGGNGSS